MNPVAVDTRFWLNTAPLAAAPIFLPPALSYGKQDFS